jgi:fluoride exporter
MTRRRASDLGLYAAVALGSALGALARWGVGAALVTAPSGGIPWGTLAANASGSLLIGLFAALVVPAGRIMVGHAGRQLVIAGFCGGYTTFSIFSLETLALAAGGALGRAAVNVALSMPAWLLAVWAGWALGRAIGRRMPPPA